MRASDHLDDGRDAIALDARDDAREPIAGGLRDDRPVARRPSTLVEQARHVVDLDEPLTAGRTLHPEPALGFPAPERLDRDLEHLGRLAHPEARAGRLRVLSHPEEYRPDMGCVSRSCPRFGRDSAGAWVPSRCAPSRTLRPALTVPRAGPTRRGLKGSSPSPVDRRAVASAPGHRARK